MENTTVRAGITITTVENGSAFAGSLVAIKGELFQLYKDGAPVKSWTVAANQPQIQPVVLAGGAEIQKNITNYSWHLDSLDAPALTDGADYTLSLINNIATLTLKNDLLKTLRANRNLYFKGTASIAGVASTVSAVIALRYIDSSGDVMFMDITAPQGYNCKLAEGTTPAVTAVTLNARVYVGSELVPEATITHKWYAYNPEDIDTDTADDWQDLSAPGAATAGYPGVVIGPNASNPVLAKGQIYIPRDAIAFSEKIKCVGAVTGKTGTVQQFAQVYDLTDPIEAYLTASSGNVNSATPTVDIDMRIVQRDTVITPRTDVVWTVQDKDGANVLFTTSQANKTRMTLNNQNTAGKGPIQILAKVEA